MTIHALPADGTSVLASRAVLARPSISQWTARKFDKTATAETIRNNGAATDAGRFNKSLLARGALADISAAVTAARTFHYAHTLPWTDDGARILPNALYLAYADEMRKRRHDFETAVDAFVRDYPAFIDAARGRLGSMFNAEDYPEASEIRKRFAFSIGIDPIPTGADFRVEIGDNIREDVERRVMEATTAAMRDALARVAEVVKTMAEKLAGYRPAADGRPAEGVFRDSLVQNVRDLAAVLPAFNLTDSPDFARVAAAVAEICKPDADAFRDDDVLRKEVADKAAALAAEADRIAQSSAAWF